MTLQKTRKLPRRLRRIAPAVRHFFTLRPRLETALRGLCALLCGFFLSGAALLGRSIPLCLAFAAAMPCGLLSVCAFCGTAAGTLLFWGWEAGLTTLACAFLIAAQSAVFRTLLPRERHWFLPVSAASYYALLCFFPLLQAQFPPPETARAILYSLGICAAVFLFLRSTPARGLLLLAGLLSAASRISLPGALPLGAVLGAMVCCAFFGSEQGILCAAVCGLSLDFSAAGPGGLCAAYLTAALACLCTGAKKRWLKILIFTAGCTLFTLFFQTISVPEFVAGLLGAVLSLLLPASLSARFSPTARTDGELSSALQNAAHAFSGLGAMLCTEPAQKPVTPADIFDAAADEVCRSCEKSAECWEKSAKDTYLALSSAAAAFLPRGRCERTDFPPFFLERCQNSEQFVASCDAILLRLRKNAQYRARLSETANALSRQYLSLSRAFSAISEPKRPAAPTCYRPEVGFRACGVRASRISGDFGCNFTANDKFYLLLCDGMGTGLPASEQAQTAAGLLRELIFAGFSPRDAIESLSSVYFLRENRAFSTVDLLEISLSTADGTLYKSGAAPSFLRMGRRVVRIGGGSLPPGCEAPPRCDTFPVSLAGGAWLVLTSDGLDADKAEQCLLSTRITALPELASELIRTAGSRNDDCSAAAVRFSELPHTS